MMHDLERKRVMLMEGRRVRVSDGDESDDLTDEESEGEGSNTMMRSS
jgi:hypothetical protein